MRFFVVALVSLAAVAHAQETLRVGTIAPDGTSWARTLRSIGDEADVESRGDARLKFYMGGVAGDEMQMLDRIRRGQLDGMMSGGMACEAVAPSLSVARVPGLFQTWPETRFVLGKLRPTLEDEAKKNGFAFLAEAIIGPSIIFSRSPVHDLAELRKQRLWIWDIDRVLRAFLPDMGLDVVPLPIHDALDAYDDKRIDGFITPAMATLSFQWSTAARYFTDLRMGFVVGCFIVANRVFDPLPIATQQALRSATAHAKARFEELGKQQEDQLLDELFAKQGLKRIAVDESVRVEFFEAARGARDKSVQALLPRGVLARVLGLLADYRSEHR